VIPPARIAAAVALAAAAALACESLARSQPSPAAVACPPKQKSHLVYDDRHEVVRREVDRNADGRADLTFFLEHERVQRAEVDLDFDGATDLWVTYDDQERIAAWEEVTPARSASAKPEVTSGRLPQDRPPLELARLIPGLDPPALPECLQRPEVQDYLQGVKKSLYGRWAVPASAAHGRTRLSFSLDRSGAVVGACVREADDPQAGAGIVTALFESAPFPAMSQRVECLSRHHLIGTFVTEPNP
jgi:hypothetical protein